MEEGRDNPSVATEKAESKKEVMLEAQGEKTKVHFATLMDSCHLQNAELEPNQQNSTKAEWCSVVTM